jgi:hypothetical protein
MDGRLESAGRLSAILTSYTVDVIRDVVTGVISQKAFGRSPLGLMVGRAVIDQANRGDFVARIVSVGLIGVLPTAARISTGGWHRNHNAFPID